MLLKTVFMLKPLEAREGSTSAWLRGDNIHLKYIQANITTCRLNWPRGQFSESIAAAFADIYFSEKLFFTMLLMTMRLCLY